jgi:hypothetical protein
MEGFQTLSKIARRVSPSEEIFGYIFVIIVYFGGLNGYSVGYTISTINTPPSNNVPDELMIFSHQ